MTDQSTERFVDVQTNPIPPQNTWDTLGMAQLIDVKNRLETKLWEFRGTPAIATSLKRSLETLNLLIEKGGV